MKYKLKFKRGLKKEREKIPNSQNICIPTKIRNKHIYGTTQGYYHFGTIYGK